MLNWSRACGAIVLSALCLLVSSAYAAKVSKEIESLMSHDGLQRIKLNEVDLTYARPGMSLKGYGKVMLDPVVVRFSKEWDPRRPGSNFKLSSEEREDIRSGIARIVREELVKQLQANDGYPVVTEPGADVLHVVVSIADLYVNAPDTMTAGRSYMYVASAGRATMVAELRDSKTGQVLVRMADRREARSTSSSLTRSNRFTNEQEIEFMASAWAKILRNSLDKARGSVTK